jgi:hypothetical protein
MTAERKKGRYTYYRCTGFRSRCGNGYIREEHLAAPQTERSEGCGGVAGTRTHGLRRDRRKR